MQPQVLEGLPEHIRRLHLHCGFYVDYDGNNDALPSEKLEELGRRMVVRR